MTATAEKTVKAEAAAKRPAREKPVTTAWAKKRTTEKPTTEWLTKARARAAAAAQARAERAAERKKKTEQRIRREAAWKRKLRAAALEAAKAARDGKQLPLPLPVAKQPKRPDPCEGVLLLRRQPHMMARLAAGLGISRASVYGWRHVPADRVADVARLSGLTPQQLRPDVFRP